MAFADPNGIQAAIAWLLGDLSRARLSGAALSLAGVLTLTIGLWARSHELDALLMGEEAAASLGIEVASARRKLMIATSLLVALTVAAAGMIGFVGLVVPHFVRKLAGPLHDRLIPLCAIWGAGAVTAADILARVLARPYELPVGAVTGLIGAPVFLLILLQSRKEI
jgi:iron complex transport system permease protein